MQPIHLTLICHAATDAQRLGRFHRPDDPLRETPGRRHGHGQWLTAPELRATQTAEALGGQATLTQALRDCDLGRWQGSALKHLQASACEPLQQWLQDPDAAPHGGESVAQLRQRVGHWLDNALTPGHWLAVTHPMVMRVALLHALQSPLTGFQQIDVQPLAELHLSWYGRWRLQIT